MKKPLILIFNNDIFYKENIIKLEKVELAEERSPDSGVVSIVSETPKSSDLEIGQVVWVWMSGYPIWPGIIAPAPATDLDHDKFMRVKEMKVSTRTQE